MSVRSIPIYPANLINLQSNCIALRQYLLLLHWDWSFSSFFFLSEIFLWNKISAGIKWKFYGFFGRTFIVLKHLYIKKIIYTVALKLNFVVHIKNLQNKDFFRDRILGGARITSHLPPGRAPFFMWPRKLKTFFVFFCFKNQNFDMCLLLKFSETNVQFFRRNQTFFKHEREPV